MLEASPAILTIVDGPIAVIRFNKPAQRNPLSMATLDALENVLIELATEKEIKALIFTGSDEVFASGANIRELAQLDTASALKFSQQGQRVMQRIAEATPLTIAAINGYCMGGALDLALACDIRIASSRAVFAHPGARLGIITGWGGTQRLPQIIGRRCALEFFVTARRYTAGEALQMGLVRSVGDPVLAEARKVAGEITEGGEEPATFT